MMNEKTSMVLNGWMALNVGKIVKEQQIVFNGNSVTWNTMRRYIQLKPMTVRNYYTMNEIVNMLNDCACNDCSNDDWFYQIDENGRIYSDDFDGYEIVGWKS